MKKNKLALIFTLILLFQSSFSFAQEKYENNNIKDGFANVVEKLLPAVVNISTTQKPKENIDQILSKLPEDKVFDQLKDILQKENLKQKKLSSLGSGFIISKDGYIFTKNHVIENSAEITISLNDGKKFIAKVIGTDKKTDSALLKIDSPTDLPFAKLGNSSKNRIGDWVIVIGNPFGLGSSVSAGIISARGRDIISEQGDFIQTDAAINRGNSGGPLFNNKGEVIGVATAIFSNSGGNIGIGFANVIEEVLPIIKQLKEQGKIIRGWIGVSIQEVNEEMAKAVDMKKPIGALVLSLKDNAPAKKAGIMPSDIIVKFDGKDIEEMKMLPQIVSKTAIGKKVKVVVIRNGQQKTLIMKVVKMPDDLQEEKEIFKEEKMKEEKAKSAVNILGFSMVNLDKELKKEYKLEDSDQGVLVIEDNQKNKAEEPKLMIGDLILSVNQIPVKSVKDLQKVIITAINKNKQVFMFLIKRQNQNLGVVIQLPVGVK